jgi:hypothetical protein
MPEPIFMELGMYITAPEPISTAHFINPSRLYVCLYVYPPIVARQRLSRHVPMAGNTYNNRTVGRDVFCAVSVSPKESLWVCLCIPLSLLCRNSVKTFPRGNEELEASVTVRSKSYERKLGDQFSPEFLV